MTEVRIRRTCSEPNPRDVYRHGMDGVECPECGAWTGRRDKFISHKEIERWVSLEELTDLLKKKHVL